MDEVRLEFLGVLLLIKKLLEKGDTDAVLEIVNQLIEEASKKKA